MFGFDANGLSKFHFSPSRVYTHIKSFLFFKPIICSEISPSYFNAVFLILLTLIFNYIAYIGARMLNINIVEVFKDIILATILKIYLPLFVALFSILVSKIFSMALDTGKLNFTYFYTSLLTTVHFPICIFLTNLKKKKINHAFIIAIMTIQGMLSHWLMCRATEQNPFSLKKYKLIVVSCLAHVFFFIMLGWSFYRLI